MFPAISNDLWVFVIAIIPFFSRYLVAKGRTMYYNVCRRTSHLVLHSKETQYEEWHLSNGGAL